MAARQIVLQSFIPQKTTVNFRYTEDKDGHKKGEAVKVGGVYKTLTIPSLYQAPKNITILTPEDFEAIREDIQGLLEQGQRGKGLVQLDDIPSGYWDPAQQVAEAKGKMNAALAERDGALMKVLELEDQVKALKDKLISYGWKDE